MGGWYRAKLSGASPKTQHLDDSGWRPDPGLRHGFHGFLRVLIPIHCLVKKAKFELELC